MKRGVYGAMLIVGLMLGAWGATSIEQHATAQTPPCPAASAPAGTHVFTGTGNGAVPFTAHAGVVIFHLSVKGSGDVNGIVYSRITGEPVNIPFVVVTTPFDGSAATPIRSAGDYVLNLATDGAWSLWIEQ